MNLEELVREVFPDLIERGDGEIYTNCPFCEERGETRDTRKRLGINYDTGNFNCFNCGFAGRENPDRLFRELCNQFELDPSDYRYSNRGSEVSTKEKKKKQVGPVALPQAFEPLWEKSKDKLHRRALGYLLSRGVTKKQIEQHMIGFCAVGEYSGRIMFPVYRKDSVVGFVTRAFRKGIEPRYLNSEGLKYLWNAPPKGTKEAILLEGVFDCLASERTIKVWPAAGLGKDLTDEQLDALKKLEKLTIVPDPDKAGLKGVARRAEKLLEANPSMKIKVVIPILGKDWGDSSEQNIKEMYEGRVSWSLHLKKRLRAKAAFL